MSQTTELLLEILLPLGSAIVALFVWIISLIKRNRKIAELANEQNTMIEMIKNNEIKTEPSIMKTAKRLCKKFHRLDLTPLNESELD